VFSARLWFWLFLLAAAALTGWTIWYGRRAPAPRVGTTVIATPSASASGLVDPLAPGRAPVPDGARAAAGGDWVTARPAFQYSRGSAQRGGTNPCAMPLADASAFEPWANLARGRFVAPREGALDASGGFDLIMHFHGDELARRELVESGQKFVLYSLTLGPDEDYAPLFAGSKLYSHLVQGIEQAVGQADGVTAHVRHVALTAWSAGFMAVLSTLAQPEAKDVDSVVLIDGLHGTRGALQHPFATLLDFARRAADGQRFLLVTHSSIDPPNFSSTTESAHYLISSLGARPQAVRRDDRVGLELIEYFTRGEFHVRGYAGNDKADHCAQVTLLRDAFSALGRRWKR
jgi:hypothetical protein